MGATGRSWNPVPLGPLVLMPVEARKVHPSLAWSPRQGRPPRDGQSPLASASDGSVFSSSSGRSTHVPRQAGRRVRCPHPGAAPGAGSGLLGTAALGPAQRQGDSGHLKAGAGRTAPPAPVPATFPHAASLTLVCSVGLGFCFQAGNQSSHAGLEFEPEGEGAICSSFIFLCC